MKFKSWGRHIREGTKSVIRNGWMSIASIGAVTVTLLLVGVFVGLLLNINEMATQVERDVEIKVLIEVTAEEDEITELQETIEAYDAVEKLSFSSKEDELEGLIEGMGDEGQIWEMIEQDNPLNHAFVVKTADPKDTERIAQTIEGLPHVYKVNYGKEVVPKLFAFNKYVRIIGIGLIVGLVLTAMFLISNTIKLTIMARSREIGIMKLVGAKNGFIRGPFFIEGLLLGVLGSILPIVLLASSYQYIYTNLSGQTSISFIELLPFNPFIYQLSLGILLLGAFIGVWGCIMSVRKFLRV